MRKSYLLPALVVQLLGVAIIVGAVVFWVLTERQSPLIYGAGISLITLGRVQGYRIVLQKRRNGRDNGDT